MVQAVSNSWNYWIMWPVLSHLCWMMSTSCRTKLKRKMKEKVCKEPQWVKPRSIEEEWVNFWGMVQSRTLEGMIAWEHHSHWRWETKFPSSLQKQGVEQSCHDKQTRPKSFVSFSRALVSSSLWWLDTLWSSPSSSEQAVASLIHAGQAGSAFLCVWGVSQGQNSKGELTSD